MSKSKKTVHLLCNDSSIYNQEFAKFINNNFNLNTHIFYVINKSTDFLIKGENVVYLNPSRLVDCLKLIIDINNSAITIMHGIYISTRLSIFLNAFTNGKKLAWMVWGADLYTWRSKSSWLRAFFSDHIQFRLRKKIRNVIISFPPDQVKISEFSIEKKRFFYAHYPFGYSEQQILDNKSAVEERGITNILIGNSANSILNHEDILNKLHLYAGENVRIHLPLNYGDRKYADTVEETARKLFGDNALCYRERMHINDYIRLLSTVDIAVFDTDRQIALGNIMLLVYMGKKLFFRENSVLYNYMEDEGIDIGKTSDLGEMELKELKTKKYSGNDYRLAMEYINPLQIKNQWEKIFNSFYTVE